MESEGWLAKRRRCRRQQRLDLADAEHHFRLALCVGRKAAALNERVDVYASRTQVPQQWGDYPCWKRWQAPARWHASSYSNSLGARAVLRFEGGGAAGRQGDLEHCQSVQARLVWAGARSDDLWKRRTGKARPTRCLCCRMASRRFSCLCFTELSPQRD